VKVQEGRYYTNGAGLIRKFERFDWRNGWRGAVYRPVSADGTEGSERFCAVSTMKGWAKAEYDPAALSGELRINVKRIRPGATFPTGAGPFDLCAAESDVIQPGHVSKVPLGLAFEIPEGYALMISAVPEIDYGTELWVSSFVVGPQDTGELAIPVGNGAEPEYYESTGEEIWGREVLTLDGDEVTWEVGREFPANTYLIRKGDRIAQGVIVPAPSVVFAEVAA